MAGTGDLESRIAKLETGMKRVDKAIVQLLELVQEVGGLTISLVSVLISGSRIRAGAKSKLRSRADGLAERFGGDDDEA